MIMDGKGKREVALNPDYARVQDVKFSVFRAACASSLPTLPKPAPLR
jgi:hypothetical protein